MPISSEAARSALGITGNVASCAFVLSSAPTVYSIIKSKTTGGLSGDLLVLKLINCLLWTLYGMPIISPNNFWVLLTNAFGSALAILYILPYIYYASRRQRFKTLSELFLLLSLLVLLVLLLFLLEHSRHDRAMVIGILCAIISSLMHLMLLSQLRKTLQTKDIKYMLPYASSLGFLKGAIWLAYGVVNLDMYIVVPNGVGIVIGGAQVILLIIVLQMKVNTIKSFVDHSMIAHDEHSKDGIKVTIDEQIVK